MWKWSGSVSLPPNAVNGEKLDDKHEPSDLRRPIQTGSRRAR
jgi:hypothetical protein